MKNSLWLMIAALIASGLVSGCAGKKPESLPAAKKVAEEQLAAAVAARKSGDVKKAADASAVALEAEKAARDIYAGIKTPVDDDKALLRATSVAAREADFMAKVTREEIELKDQVQSIKGRATCASIDLAVSGTLLALEEAARLMDRSGVQTNLSPSVSSLAAAARDLVSGVGSLCSSNQAGPAAPPLSNTSTNITDWGDVADEVKALRSTTPEEVKLVAGIGLALAGMNGLAICELERVNRAKMISPRTAEIHTLSRCLTLYLDGKSALATEIAVEELAAADRLAALTGEPVGEKAERVAVVHLMAAAMMLKDGRYSQADKELAALLQVLPDDPFVRVLKSESMAVQGDRDGAARMINETKFGDSEWLAEAVAAHAKDVRDNPADRERLFTDPRFMSRIILGFLKERAAHSKYMAKVNGVIDASRAFGAGLLDKLPLGRRAPGDR